MRAELDFNTAVQNQVVLVMENPATIKSLTENEDFVDLFFESNSVKAKVTELQEELSTTIRNAIIDDVSKQDTLKVSTRAEMSKRLDIREENYFPLLEKALKAVLKEENASKKDAQNIAKRAVKTGVKPSSLKPPIVPAEF